MELELSSLGVQGFRGLGRTELESQASGFMVLHALNLSLRRKARTQRFGQPPK